MRQARGKVRVVDRDGVIWVRLVGDVLLHREGLAALLAQDGRLRVAAVDGCAQPDAATAPADVIVLDAAASEGYEWTRRAVAGATEPIVAFSVPDDERDVLAMAESGVIGFVERDASLDELVASVLSAARGEASFPPRIATTLLRRVSSLGAGRPSPAEPALTVREHQIVELIADALSNKEIATRLGIEVATVKNHVHNILEKLQVSRRTEAVARLRVVEGGARGHRAAVRYMAGLDG
jgi:two-component system nitrate/nitrite response regulator NarL